MKRGRVRRGRAKAREGRVSARESGRREEYEQEEEREKRKRGVDHKKACNRGE